MEETEIGEVSVDKSAKAAHEKAHEEQHRAPWLRWLALSTAIFAVVAAVASLKSGRYANEAILHQSRASLTASAKRWSMLRLWRARPRAWAPIA